MSQPREMISKRASSAEETVSWDHENLKNKTLQHTFYLLTKRRGANAKGCCYHWDSLTAPRTPVATYANTLICSMCDTSVQVSHLYPVTRGTPLFFQMT